ncbi:protein wech-like [Haliotis asinina]|uniref:protein wech-like n=1 Tax=Haliotis asinina TaxID=109174 RepID=UPI00353180E0
MATLDYKKLTENHLTCAICTNVFTDPATLECNHTFCKTCLLKYTKTHPEAIQAKSIHCPSCRQQTKVTSGSSGEEWVSELKPSHVIQDLMDDFLPAIHALQDDNGCGICTAQGKTTAACSWCSLCDCAFCDGCLKMHSVMPMSHDHEVVDLPNHTKMNRCFMCNVHRNEKMKVFCTDCRKAVCTVCCSTDHRKCDEVDTIESMVPIVKEQLTNKMKRLRVNMATTKKFVDLRKDTFENIRSNAQNIKDQIQKARETLVDVILRKERHLIDDVNEFCNSHSQKFQREVAHLEKELQLFQQQYETISGAVTSNTEMDMFAIYESMDEASPDNRQTDNLAAPGRVVFTHNMDKLRKAVDELGLGEVDVVHDISDRHSCPVLHHSIDLKDDEDTCDPSLHDVTVVTVNGIKVTIVADCGNNKLKAYYTSKSKSFHKHLLFSDYPWQIANLTGSQVAVTIPDINEIVTVDITQEPIVLSTVKTSKQYCVLAYLSPSQLVAGTYTDNVDILDLAGNVLHSFNTGLIGSPDFIHVTSNKNLILSNEDVYSLVSLTCEGGPICTYTPKGGRTLTCPQGIATTTTGDILLVDETSNNVRQLSESMQFVRYVLQGEDGLHSPDGICVDDDGLLYVTPNGYVKVYTFCVDSDT